MHFPGRHHLHVRERIHQKHEPFPHPDPFKRFFDKAMFFVAIVGPLITLPQVFQVFATREVAGLSFVTWFSWTVLSAFWMIYGILHKDVPIAVSQGLYIALNGAVLVAIMLYN